jgi:hypothetical protein
MMCAVTDANSSDGSSNGQQDEQGVLANLPRTRPQRASRRRVAARNTAGGTAGAGGAPPSRGERPVRPTETPDRPAPRTGADRPAAAQPEAGKPGAKAAERPRRSVRGGTSARRQKSAPRSRISSQDAAPRQGFECDGEVASGPVQPPGAAELVASAAEIVGELAKAGWSTGERLLKDVVSRLPLS